jgi:hypothetical protein
VREGVVLFDPMTAAEGKRRSSPGEDNRTSRGGGEPPWAAG